MRIQVFFFSETQHLLDYLDYVGEEICNIYLLIPIVLEVFILLLIVFLVIILCKLFFLEIIYLKGWYFFILFKFNMHLCSLCMEKWSKNDTVMLFVSVLLDFTKRGKIDQQKTKKKKKNLRWFYSSFCGFLHGAWNIFYSI